MAVRSCCVVVAILLLDVAIQGINILNQTRMFAVSGEARSRLNTAFVTNNFLWGAVGSVLATVLWGAGGWTAVTLCGAGLAAVALVVWAFGRRGPLVVPSVLSLSAGPTYDGAVPRWIELDELANLRDVGGVPTTDGGEIAPGRLLRSDNLQTLTDADVDALLALGVTDVVDLRSDYERDAGGPRSADEDRRRAPPALVLPGVARGRRVDKTRATRPRRSRSAPRPSPTRRCPGSTSSRR